MAQVVQAKCPFCKIVLRIPTQWLSQPMRCKHCQQIFQAQQKPAKSKPAYPVSKPAAPPPGLPPLSAAVTSQPPKAIPMGASAPVAAPFSAPPMTASSGNPFAFDDPSDPSSNNGVIRRRRRQQRGWWKGALLGMCVLTVAGLMLIFYGERLQEFIGTKEEPRAETTKKDSAAKSPQIAGDATKDAAPRDNNTKKDPPRVVTDGSKDPSGKDKDTPKDPVNKDSTKPKDSTNKDKEKSPPKDSINKDKEKNPPKDTVDKDKDKSTPKDPIIKDAANKDKTPAKDPPSKDGTAEKDGAKKDKGDPKDPPVIVKDPPPPSEERWPRRALAITVSNYLYTNPIAYGEKELTPGKLLALLPKKMNFDQTQLVELSDRAETPYPPLKPVIETTFLEFLKTSRPQDRIVVYFAGHAVEMEKEVYLVPLEGDPSDKATLISLKTMLEQLKDAKVRQKVLILDVCRLDPKRAESKGSSAMGEVLDALLKEPPQGVQIWSACVAGEYSYEEGGVPAFLEALCRALKEPKKGLRNPEDSLPFDEKLVAKVNGFLRIITDKNKQTSRLAGKEPASGAPYSPKEELPPPLQIKLPGGALAKKDQVKRILDDINHLPPARAEVHETAVRFTVESLPPFTAQALKDYDADYTSWAELEDRLAKGKLDDQPVRKAVVRAHQTLNKYAGVKIEAKFAGTITPQVKDQTKQKQVEPALALDELQSALDEMKSAAKKLTKEPSKRWRANFDYTLVRLEARIIYLYEYSFALGTILRDALPGLDKGANGWQMVTTMKPKASEKTSKALAADIAKTLKKLAKDHPYTPWAVLARRELSHPLGLEWRVSKN
jgi:hypothetical protein